MLHSKGRIPRLKGPDIGSIMECKTKAEPLVMSENSLRGFELSPSSGDPTRSGHAEQLFDLSGSAVDRSELIGNALNNAHNPTTLRWDTAFWSGE
jgi:hypothetical protein